MYSIYIPKYEGERDFEFKLPRVLTMYMEVTKYKYNLLSLPGYLSRTDASISAFINRFEHGIMKGNPTAIGFFHGMNGSQLIAGRESIIKGHYRQFRTLQVIDVKCKDLKDHRKMLFFFEMPEDIERNSEGEITLNNSTKDYFIDNIRVGAILIGSSNQSWNTYYAGGRTRADKGESDLLMFSEAYFAEDFTRIVNGERLRDLEIENDFGYNPNLDFSDCVVFESLTHKNDENYFKDILRDVLEHNLS